jgi:hypothetical protein
MICAKAFTQIFKRISPKNTPLKPTNATSNAFPHSVTTITSLKCRTAPTHRISRKRIRLFPWNNTCPATSRAGRFLTLVEKETHPLDLLQKQGAPA